MTTVFILEDFLYCLWILNNENNYVWDSVTKSNFPVHVPHAILNHRQNIIIKYEE